MEQPRADSMSEDRPRSGYLGIALFLIASLLPAGSETSDSWPQWGGPDRDFRVADKEVLAVLEGRSWTPPTLAGTVVYLRNRREAVALDLGDRSE